MHFLAMVFTDGGFTTDELLEPYCENVRVPRRISKEELIRIEQDNFTKYNERVPKELHMGEGWTDEQLYEYATRDVDIAYINKDGSVFFDDNPNAKWDWYIEGGRWNKSIRLLDGSLVNRANANNIDFDSREMKEFPCYAIVTPIGEWIENTTDSSSFWKEIVKQYMCTARDKGWYVTIIDCHI